MSEELLNQTGNPVEEPVSEEPQSPVQESEPEYALDDEGELRIADAPEPPKEKPYTPDEIRDIGLDKLDPKRIPPELVPFYKSMQGDYTRKTQSLREKEKELEALRAQPPQPQTQQPVQPQQPQMTEQEAQDLFFKTAKQRAAAMLGIKEDDFDEYDAKHMSYLTVASNDLYTQAQQEMNRRRYVEEKRHKYNELLGKLKQEEPHYDEINQWALGYVETLPYKEYSKYVRTFNEGSIEEIEGVIQQIRKAWYQQKKAAVPKEAPPTVESGSNAEEEPRKRITTRQFAAMTPEEKAEFLRDNGYAG